mmetsp:Transcript_110293/g.235576  ORF Transcript_110293/g.235576 Transcript_110293/m.235576 type:complete len:130 (-) Transcript_110293:130-519(-)
MTVAFKSLLTISLIAAAASQAASDCAVDAASCLPGDGSSGATDTGIGDGASLLATKKTEVKAHQPGPRGCNLNTICTLAEACADCEATTKFIRREGEPCYAKEEFNGVQQVNTWLAFPQKRPRSQECPN